MIFSTQRSNPRLSHFLHWQTFFTTYPHEKPMWIKSYKFIFSWEEQFSFYRVEFIFSYYYELHTLTGLSHSWYLCWSELPGGYRLFSFLKKARCNGERNGNPLQCSCLENPRDGGAWWAAVYGVAQGRTWLKQLSSSINKIFLLNTMFY